MRKQVVTATALTLLLGVSTFSLNTAIAQNGGEARSNDREMKKELDDKHLTPIRPIRRVGEDNWPTAKNQPPPVETTGQSAKQDPNKQDDKKEETARQQPAKQEPVKQDTAKQEPAKQEPAKQETAKQDIKPDASKPEPKQETAKQDTAKPDSTQNTAKQDTAKQDTAKPASTAESKPAPQQGNTDANRDTAKNSDQEKDKDGDKGFASIRLGTDKDGRVAINDAQERQITTVMRKQRVDAVNVKVSVGSVAPANVRVVAVSSDMVDILPQFRGYSYFATREEVVIVEPSTKKVVALIPVSLTATASRPSEERTTRTETRRTETQRDDNRRNETRTTSRTRERDVTVGRTARSDDFPTREEILAAPVVRGQSGPAVSRTYRTERYYDPGDDVVIIERRRPRVFGFW